MFFELITPSLKMFRKHEKETEDASSKQEVKTVEIYIENSFGCFQKEDIVKLNALQCLDTIAIKVFHLSRFERDFL